MKKKILRKLQELEDLFPERNFKYKVKFNLSSKKIMGMYQYKYKRKDILYFNYQVAKQVGFKMFKEVVIHEFGHLKSRKDYGYKVPSHGKEWRKVMFELGSIKPRATIDFSKNSESFKIEFKMKCKCKNHYFSQNKRTRLRTGTKYKCNDCDKKIKEC